jgi:signal transduction histidine kinase
MNPPRLNTIATRFAVTIILAIILGVALEFLVIFGLAYFGLHHNGGGDVSLPGQTRQAADQRTRVIVARSAIIVFDKFRQPLFVFNVGRNHQLLETKIATLMHVVASAPAPDRARIAAAITQPNLQVSIRDAPLSQLTRTTDIDLLRQLIEYQLGSEPGSVIVGTRSTSEEPEPDLSGDTLLAETALQDGHWLVIAIPHYVPIFLWRMAIALSPLFLVIGLLSAIAGRRLAAPIRHFAEAAERLGVDPKMPPLAERGPHELRTAIRAFNRMQERLRLFVDDRTQMLAAMLHDLRTPLNRLRLRAEFIEDTEQQRMMFSDLTAMNAMIDTTLAFARDDACREQRKLVDLGILVEDICEDVADAGGAACYYGPHGVNIRCRPTAISRAVANLIDNAVKYAGAARVRLFRESDRVVISIEDDGPGIPIAQQEKVFTAFYRLEPSRNIATGGVGLGLSIARTIAREHGGDITLANRDGGGLCARLELPF